ncbi:flagellar hook-basal body protein [Thermoproteota archaeon]
MLEFIHMAKSFQWSTQRRMQVITTNIANAKTPGFKLQRINMESILPTPFEDVIAEMVAEGDIIKKKRRHMEYGLASRIIDTQRKFEQGSLEFTNRPLDLAIVGGRGLFQYRLSDGRIAYSKAGNMKTDNEGYIVDPNGHRLEPAIQIPQGTTDFMINEEGRVFVQLDNEPVQQEIGQIVLADFDNIEALRSYGQNLFIQTLLSGDPILRRPSEEGAGRISQNTLELSNVNLIEEMMNMMITHRSFEYCVNAQSSVEDLLKEAMKLTDR